MQRDCVQSFAAHAALFIIMSIFPLAMFLISFINRLPIEIDTVIGYANDFLPDTILPLILQIINEVYSIDGHTIKWVTLITVLYCASKGFFAIRVGLNAVYGIRESRNIVMKNIVAVGTVVIFSVMLCSTLFVVILGEDLLNLIMLYTPKIIDYQSTIRIARIILILVILTLVFLMMYAFIPSRRTKLKYEIRGAVFTAVGWTVFSYGFSFYKANVAQFTVVYGSLATMIVFMMWFYWSMYIFFLGAECNYFYRKYLENGKDMDKVMKQFIN